MGYRHYLYAVPKSKQLARCLIAVFIIIATICTLASCSESDRVNNNK